MVLSFSEVTELKNAAQEKFGAAVHFHDSCAGQYFSLEEADGELNAFIALYFADRNLRAVFSDDGLSFRVEA